jgi:hypothetical protein
MRDDPSVARTRYICGLPKGILLTALVFLVGWTRTIGAVPRKARDQMLVSAAKGSVPAYQEERAPSQRPARC